MKKSGKRQNNDKISTIIENDIIANASVLDEHIKEEEEKHNFQWIYNTILNDPKYDDLSYEEKYNLFENCCGYLKNDEEEEDEEDEEDEKLYMYFLSLENDKMFLHTDYKKEHDEILKICERDYEFVKICKPIKVVFLLEIEDLYDIDKYVKIFMHMFGINEIRGGSYIEPNLPEYLIKFIEYEKKITEVGFYKKKK